MRKLSNLYYKSNFDHTGQSEFYLPGGRGGQGKLPKTFQLPPPPGSIIEKQIVNMYICRVFMYVCEDVCVCVCVKVCVHVMYFPHTDNKVLPLLKQHRVEIQIIQNASVLMLHVGGGLS